MIDPVKTSNDHFKIRPLMFNLLKPSIIFLATVFVINDNETTHHLKIKVVFEGGSIIFFTNDGPPYHEITL